MTVSQALPLLQGLFSSALFLLVARQEWHSSLNRRFLLFLGAMALWGFAIGGMRLSTDLGQALWWEKSSLAFIGLTAASFYFFVRRYTSLGWEIDGPLVVLFLLATVAVLPTGLLVKGMGTDRYGNAPVWGPLFPIWAILSYALVITAAIRLEQARRASASYEARNRHLYFLMGAGACLTGAGSDALSATGLPIYPMAIPANMAFSTLTAIAILKYRLLDIRVTLRKGLTYLLSSALASVLFAVVLFAIVVSVPYLEVWVANESSSPLGLWWLILAFLAMVLLYEPLGQRAREFLERRVYRKKYDYLAALEQFNEESRGITEMDQLGSLIVNLADRTLQPTSVGLVVASANGDFTLAGARDLEQPPQINLPAIHPLPLWLQHYPNVLWRQELEIFPSLQAMSVPERNALNPLKAELYCPIITQGRLIGILALGPKQRGQIFSREDLYLLSSIGRQAAVNLENVRLLKLERERALHLKKLEEMKSDFMAAVSHQLKTPLTSIKVSAGILGDSRGQVPDELRERLVDEITRGVDDLQSLISSILDFAKMQTATLKLNRQPVDLRVIIKEVARLLAPQVRLKEQTLELSLPDFAPRVRVDGERIRQVLVCLLSNANKFTPRGGRISVSLQGEANSVSVEVKDTGPGITPEEHDKIFEAYYQVKDVTGRSPSGTGLGLAIAKGLVELHGGRIWVDSSPGAGAAFLFNLPAVADDSVEQAAERAEIPEGKPVPKLPWPIRHA